MHSHQSLHHTWGESASFVCRPPNYEGEMSYEERGLLRSYELNELRDRLAKEVAMQPPSQPPSQPPQQPAPPPTRLATAGGGLAMPEGFTQVGNTNRCPYTYVSKSCQKKVQHFILRHSCRNWEYGKALLTSPISGCNRMQRVCRASCLQALQTPAVTYHSCVSLFCGTIAPELHEIVERMP